MANASPSLFSMIEQILTATFRYYNRLTNKLIDDPEVLARVVEFMAPSGDISVTWDWLLEQWDFFADKVIKLTRRS